MTGKKEIIEILHNYKKEFAGSYGLLDIGVFGSVARDDFGEVGLSIPISFVGFLRLRRTNLLVSHFCAISETQQHGRR